MFEGQLVFRTVYGNERINKAIYSVLRSFSHKIRQTTEQPDIYIKPSNHCHPRALVTAVGEAGRERGDEGSEGACAAAPGGRSTTQQHHRVAEPAWLVLLPSPHPLSTSHVPQAHHRQDSKSPTHCKPGRHLYGRVFMA